MSKKRTEKRDAVEGISFFLNLRLSFLGKCDRLVTLIIEKEYLIKGIGEENGRTV